MPQEERKGANYSTPNPGPFLAKVVSHLDPSYMGSLEVQLLHESGNDEDREGQLRVVKHLNPFYGTTSLEFVGERTHVKGIGLVVFKTRIWILVFLVLQLLNM